MSNQLDSHETVRKCVAWLRDQDKRLYDLPTATKYYLQWDLDDIRYMWRNETSQIPFNLFGHDIYLTGDKKQINRKPGTILMYIDDLLVMQFFPQKSFDELMTVYTVFGKCRLIKIDGDKELDKLNKYCSEMDKKISDGCERLRQAGVRDIFDKLWLEFGGKLIKPTDRLGNRIAYYRTIVNEWRQNKEEWNDEMLRLGLLRVK